jgi:polar amino acid transport system substrate-binding protein
MRAKIILFAGLGIALSVLLAPSAWARSCGPFSVGFYELGLLYHHDVEAGFVGIDKDVVQAVQQRSECEFKPVLESRVRIWQQLADGRLDMSVSGIPSPERERFAEFVPYFQTRNFALMRRDLARELPTPDVFLADGRRKAVVVKGFQHGATYDALLAQLRAQERVIDAADFGTAQRLFLAGRADLMLALPTSWGAAFHKDGQLDQLAVLDWSPRDRIVHGLVLSRERMAEAHRLRLRQAVESLIVDGSIDAIFRRYVGERLAREMRVELAPTGAGPTTSRPRLRGGAGMP